MPEETLSEHYRRVSENLTMIRGNRGFGRRPSKSFMAEAAKLGPVSIHHYDEADDRTIIETIHDTAPILAANKAEYNSGHDGYTPSRDLRKVAAIPCGWVNILMHMGIDCLDSNDTPKLLALLDDPSYIFLRTAPGKLSRRPVQKIFVPARSR